MTVGCLAPTNAPGAKFLPANFRENCANREVVEVTRYGRTRLPDAQYCHLDDSEAAAMKSQPHAYLKKTDIMTAPGDVPA